MGEKIENLVLLTQVEGLDQEDVDLILALSKDDDLVLSLSKGLLERAPGKEDNWVEKNGGLPPYIEEVANSLHTKRGMTISRAIATAVSRMKIWAVTGTGETKAKAVKALAAWNAMKAKNAAKKTKD